jgi:hypothetical protein
MYTLMPPTPPPPKKALVLPKATNVFLPHLTFPVGELHSPPPWYFQELLGSADLVHWKSLWYYVSNPLVEVTYLSNTLSHVVTPVGTNYYTNCMIVTNKDVNFFRLRGQILPPIAP